MVMEKNLIVDHWRIKKQFWRDGYLIEMELELKISTYPEPTLWIPGRL